MSKNILVIEDDSILQNNIKKILEEEKFKVQQIFDGEDAKQAIKDQRPDLILLDLMLPGLDGYHVLESLKETGKTKDIPVIVLTVIGTENSIKECKMLGADDYLVKADYTLAEVTKKVKKH